MRWFERRHGATNRRLRALALVACGVLGAFGVRRALSRPSASNAARAADRARAEPVDPVDTARARLAEYEAERRRATDFAQLAPANLTHGTDPYALARLDAQHFVGVLRGASALVLLDAELHELERVPVANSAISLAVTAPEECWVAGETSAKLERFRFDGRHLVRREVREIPQVFGFRALAAGPAGALYALDISDGRLLTVRASDRRPATPDSRFVGHGPLSLARVGDLLIVDVLLDHALIVFRLGPRGEILEERARIVHDGPIWGFSAAALADGEALLSLTGVEDHPLDRSDGAFGYIDSFVFQYLLPKVGPVRRLWSVNVSELGVVTPKAPLLSVQGARAKLFVSGYGSDRAATFAFDVHGTEPPETATLPFVPGSSASIELASGVLGFADPLLDAWIVRRPSRAQEASLELRHVVAERTPRASAEGRLGEALFFTTLMAPSNSSAGKRSRFTCETCHFEGYVDGRVHHTGRGDVRVATKPLRGLFNNRPHFSRALDPDLATVSHHEFRVAGEGNGTDPWFTLHTSDFPWLEPLGVTDAELGPESLRRALMTFLMGFSHTMNPAVSGRHGFDPAEQRGAELFRDHCARCHAARLQSDVTESVVPFAKWPQAIFSQEGPIVWASADYQKTGVTPYVHELGARVPSLRRLYAKWPHFTNGSADTIRDVLAQARFDRTRFFHQSPPPDAGLSALAPSEIEDLAAFLELL